MPLTKQLRWK